MVRNVETSEEFRKILQENKRVVTKFFGDWCGPCKQILPHYEALEQKYQPDIVFLKVNIGELLDVAEEAQVLSTPTFQFYLDGQVHGRVRGASIAEVTQSVEALAAA
ncbi:Cytoplasmic thioredoxin isoenzyme 2 [Actinomortierella ambigua]|nr:Cytoplasmic thioredoxin isoenzyme 2 [Actinomortierella ambigua]